MTRRAKRILLYCAYRGMEIENEGKRERGEGKQSWRHNANPRRSSRSSGIPRRRVSPLPNARIRRERECLLSFFLFFFSFFVRESVEDALFGGAFLFRRRLRASDCIHETAPSERKRSLEKLDTRGEWELVCDGTCSRGGHGRNFKNINSIQRWGWVKYLRGRVAVLLRSRTREWGRKSDGYERGCATRRSERDEGRRLVWSPDRTWHKTILGSWHT